MGYLALAKRDQRLARLRSLMQDRNLDVTLVDYDEFNIGNGDR